jgi:hypothetical protein
MSFITTSVKSQKARIVLMNVLRAKKLVYLYPFISIVQRYSVIQMMAFIKNYVYKVKKDVKKLMKRKNK